MAKKKRRYKKQQRSEDKPSQRQGTAVAEKEPISHESEAKEQAQLKAYFSIGNYDVTRDDLILVCVVIWAVCMIVFRY